GGYAMNIKIAFRVAASFLILLLTFSSAESATYSPKNSDLRQHTKEWGFPHKNGVVLVLCGGGMKGLSHVGVIEVLERENIPIAAIVGTSMGAIIGGFYATGRTADELKQIIHNTDFIKLLSEGGNVDLANKYNKPAKPRELLLSYTADSNREVSDQLGLMPTKNLYAYLNEMTSNTSVTDFNSLPIPFAAVATNLLNGEEVIMRDGNLASALRASMSLPVIFEPWERDGKLLVDGGLSANLPVLEAKKLFPGHPVVAINLSPEDITVTPKSLKTFLDVAAQSLQILMVDNIRKNTDAADVVIAPDLKGFTTLTMGFNDEILDRGREAAEEKIDEIRALVSADIAVCSHNYEMPYEPPKTPVVAEVRFEGVSDKAAAFYSKFYRDWIGRRLDMKAVAEAVRYMNARDDIRSVDSRTERLADGRVAVIFSVARYSKYEFGLDGFASNLSWNSWVALSGTARSLLIEGDSLTLEGRIGTNINAMMRYFTPLTGHSTQLGLSLYGRRESFEAANFNKYGTVTEIERYAGKLAWYKDFDNGTRVGVGYAGMQSYVIGDADEFIHGPYLYFSLNVLDDQLMPRKGVTLMSDIWYVTNHNIVSTTRFRAYLPLFKNGSLTFGGGLHTGDADNPTTAVSLGQHQELYSLGQHPLLADQAYWLHLGYEREIMRSWWGGVNVEIFGNYGETLNNWSRDMHRWEAGLAFSLPTNTFRGKLLFVYDSEGGFTIGYTIGVPNFWAGPLP
ncbi:MAG: patatin-like phospholipase family protein, partial [Synergistes sp.]|nr:patatin-like phospholipase family protein [Synergistes sp.]